MNNDEAHGAKRDEQLAPRVDGILSSAVRRGELLAADCPSREVLRHLTSRWGVLVLIALEDGPMRFSDLRRKVSGVSEKMLSQTLQALEADGFLDRHSRPVVPPHVDYNLTPLGHEAAERVRLFADWIEDNIGRILRAREARTPEDKGHPTAGADRLQPAE
ncbi:winged helix-turn-helix transcriptional regulator [Roseibium limicola]|uniref:Helix-turn-helix transcriptional regulator n=1 Tax=Roseibium limicola TaxID=2816037 RepID=A0A939EQI5_9HYPH|nr:helix-turn-helix domain-containing protein [Roseibium limicola]MBO0345244.1 helix-turn-helix transcriptional regulator [Roseibium limicola]